MTDIHSIVLSMTNNDHVYGHVAHGWESVRSIFEKNLIDGLDIGASVCIYYRGKCVVDLCGGWKDVETKKNLIHPIHYN
jgi:hypothetical protein